MRARRSVTQRVSPLGGTKPPPEDERKRREGDAEDEPEPRERIERRLLASDRGALGHRERGGVGARRSDIPAPHRVAPARRVLGKSGTGRCPAERRAGRCGRPRWDENLPPIVGALGRRGRCTTTLRLVQGGVRRGGRGRRRWGTGGL